MKCCSMLSPGEHCCRFTEIVTIDAFLLQKPPFFLCGIFHFLK